MKHKDFLARVAGLEVTPGEQVTRKFQDWIAGTIDQDKLEWANNVAQFATFIDLPLERISRAEGPVEEKQEEALFYYMMALWKAYELGPRVRERVSIQKQLILELEASDERMERMIDKASVQQEQALERKALLEEILEQLRSLTGQEDEPQTESLSAGS